MSEQKPVAWIDDFGNVFPLGANKGAASWMDDHKRNWKPLFLAAPPAQPVVTKHVVNADYRALWLEQVSMTQKLCAQLTAQPAQAQPARLSDGDIVWYWFATTEEDEIWPSVVKFAHAIAAAVVPQGFVVVEKRVIIEALERMDRARHILTDGNPRPECNWGMLDTADLRAMIEAAKATK